MLPPTLAPSPGSPQLAHSSCCPKPSALVQLLLHLIPSCHRQISPLSSPHSLLVISSTAILLILKKHPMFLFADGQHSKKEKKKKKKKKKPVALKWHPQTRLTRVRSYLLLAAPARPFIIVICTNAILCPEIFLRHLIL